MTTKPADHRRVLIIDDDAVFREVLEDNCCELGWTVVTAATRDEAIVATGVHETDLVLLDFNLGDSDALTVIPELGMVSPKTPIVVVTGQAAPEVRSRVKRAGGNAVIGKPCSIEEVRMLLGCYSDSSTVELSA